MRKAKLITRIVNVTTVAQPLTIPDYPIGIKSSDFIFQNTGDENIYLGDTVEQALVLPSGASFVLGDVVASVSEAEFNSKDIILRSDENTTLRVAFIEVEN